MEIKKLLIIGGTGFIGRNLANKSIESGYSVTVLSLNGPPQEPIKQIHYIKCDIRNLKNLQENLKNSSFDYVVNLGGYVDHSSFLNGGTEVIESHLLGLINILKTINWKPIKRFVQIGSSDEYGNSPAPQNEKMEGLPISPYSYGKLAAKELLSMLYRSEKLPIVVIRLFLVYGPGQNSERFLPQIIKGCLCGKSFSVSEGEQLRDFCYIDDITRGLLLTLTNDESSGEIFNLGSGRPVKIKKVIQTIKDVIGTGNPDFGKIAYRKDENMALYADIKKASQILNWQPEVSFNDGLNKTILYFKE
tara:strand:+ start:2426 stop:3337 length:912 start_codon:yes stop_codon:yes gene_type:complete